VQYVDYIFSDNHYSLLVDNYTYLTDNITVSSKLLDTLRIAKVLDDEEVQEIQSKQTECNKTEQLLRFILRTSPEQYQLFLRSLNEADHTFVYNKLCGRVLSNEGFYK